MTEWVPPLGSLHGSCEWTSENDLTLLRALLDVLLTFSFGVRLLGVNSSLLCARSEKSHVTSYHVTYHLASTTLSLFEAQPTREKAVQSPQKG